MQPGQMLAQSVLIAGFDLERCAAGRLGDASPFGDDHGAATGHAFQHAERIGVIEKARHDENILLSEHKAYLAPRQMTVILAAEFSDAA